MEILDTNKKAFVSDKKGKPEKVEAFLKSNFANVPYTISSDGMVTIGGPAYTLSQAQKNLVLAFLDTL